MANPFCAKGCIMDQDNQKLDNTEIAMQGSALAKLQNFWYHNKWTVIIAAFFLCVVLVCTLQMFGKDNYDVTVLSGTTVRMDAEQREAFLAAVQGMLPEDYDKDGDKAVGLVEYQIFSEEERLVEVETEVDGVETVIRQEQVSAKWNLDQFNGFRDAVSKTGEYSLCFVSPYVYENLVKGYVVKDKVVRLGDTDFYRYNEAVQVLPADTLVCLLVQNQVVGASSKDDVYARSVALFEAIVTYDVKE